MMKKICEFFCNHFNLALFVSAMSGAALCFAWTLQYGFNKLPCPLCYWQRYPYMVNFFVGLVAAVLAKKAPKLGFYVLLLAGAVFAVNIGISFFHIGVEQGWWKGLTTCGGGVGPPEEATVEELMKYFENAPIVDCRVAGWSLFGVSMTQQNFIFSIFLTVFTYYHAIKGYLDARKKKT